MQSLQPFRVLKSDTPLWYFLTSLLYAHPERLEQNSYRAIETALFHTPLWLL